MFFLVFSYFPDFIDWMRDISIVPGISLLAFCLDAWILVKFVKIFLPEDDN